MVGRVEDYAIVGDMQPAALICADGSLILETHASLVQTALNLGGHAGEHRRGPRDGRRSVPG